MRYNYRRRRIGRPKPPIRLSADRQRVPFFSQSAKLPVRTKPRAIRPPEPEIGLRPSDLLSTVRSSSPRNGAARDDQFNAASDRRQVRGKLARAGESITRRQHEAISMAADRLCCLVPARLSARLSVSRGPKGSLNKGYNNWPDRNHIRRRQLAAVVCQLCTWRGLFRRRRRLLADPRALFPARERRVDLLPAARAARI